MEAQKPPAEERKSQTHKEREDQKEIGEVVVARQL